MANYNNNFFVDPEEDRQSRAKVDKLIWLLILIGATLIPLLIGGATFPFVSPVITESVTIQTGAKGDFFTYYKVMALTTLSVLILLLLIYKTLFIGYRVLTTWVNYLLFGGSLMVMLSAYLSPFSNIALWGMYNRFDGAMTTIFYILLVFALINIYIPKKNYIYLIYTQIPFVLVNFGMSVLYFLNKDLLNYPAFKSLMSIFLKEGDSLESTTRMMGTLNQINYMSGTFGAMALLFLVWAVVETTIRHRVIALVMSLLSFAIVLMATSFSGFFTLVVGGLIAIVLLVVAGYRKQLALYGSGFATVKNGTCARNNSTQFA